jgi:hypothetical protein
MKKNLLSGKLGEGKFSLYLSQFKWHILDGLEKRIR